ncbi:bifunctional metallophosphatase/5'-nucleotidase [Salinimicrobium sediminilitoris]|uniref:bifunctional metallophosphatase/5'-nucleotidase n=1 Tax=Salinimicrobium sediminilitoris TaxID=2876715 RepID=UPI001E35059A|nr:5'-nucleotidase C-terminal domain-containing protein [Salinimicrobium sediminilitoris]MCC8359649.1 5'-nucleotidase C-terminal domain-containing protein [Salinimicrobium sediminilitoris]
MKTYFSFSASEYLQKMTFLAGILILVSCSSDNANDPTPPEVEPQAETIVIYSINDPHGKIHNFGRIKAIIDAEKESESQVFFVSGGDIFSGNPIVDYHPEKGFPMVDLMGRAGMDVSALGNHEFDYGQEVLQKRMLESAFPFLCANIESSSSGFTIPQGKVILEKDDFEIAFISVVETGSADNKPLSHPKKLKGLEFKEGVNAMEKYRNDPEVMAADLVVALTHYGREGDKMILEQHDFVDLVVGGHNHAVYSEKVAGRYMVQSGSNLKLLTKLSLTVENGEVVDYRHELIDLDQATETDEEMEKLISEYNNKPEFFEEIGTSLRDHSTPETACFYTDALRTVTGADIVFQNYGGIRAGLDYGSITPFDLYTIDPFQNGLDSFNMTVEQLETFLNADYAPSLAYSGIKMEYRNGRVELIATDGKMMDDAIEITVAVNDYLSNVYEQDFQQPTKTYEKTTAEYLIDYLEQYQSTIDNAGCNRSI